ncbi:MAG: hypothetical protein ACFFBP_11705 [Promethearchaeota archaeon]
MKREVKGTALKDIIIGIRSDKAHIDEYNKILSDEAKDLLNQRILTSIWYPYNIYIELYDALIKVIAKNNTKTVIQWGREFGIKAMNTIYRNLIAEGDVKKLIQKYPRFQRMMYNFGTLTIEWLSNNEILITSRDFENKFKMIFYSNMGWMQGAIEICIKKMVNYEFLKKSWEGDDETQYKLYWSP